jgi:hypothetical protein
MYLDVFRLSFYNRQRLSFFISCRIRMISSRPTCCCTTTCYCHWPPLCTAAYNMELFLSRQLVQLAAFQELIPLGACADYQTGAHKRCGNGRPGAIMCKTSKIRIIRCIQTDSAQFSTGWIFIILPHHGHKRAVVALSSRVCAGIKEKQEQNSAIPHCVDAHAKILASIRWAHKHQVLAV